MQFELMGYRYTVWFNYDDKTKWTNKITLCYIERVNSDTGEVEKFSDCAFLHPRNRVPGNCHYSRVKGRKVAFAKVVKKIVPRESCHDIALRRALWRAYFWHVRDLRRRISAEDKMHAPCDSAYALLPFDGLRSNLCPCGEAVEFSAHASFANGLPVPDESSTTFAK